MKKKITVPGIMATKGSDKKLSMVACYDYSSASLVEASNVDMILVGDSLGMAMLGYKGTVGVTVDDMIYHIRPVVKGAPNTFVVGDMPFGAYNSSIDKAVENASRVFAEGGCDCVKMEGGMNTVPYIEAVVKAGVPVMGHIGLTPQTSALMGGFKVQGKNTAAADLLLETAKAIEAAGAFLINLEGIPVGVAKRITEELKIPTMGIGAGPYCDSQDLVWVDIMGYNEWVPKFAKKYCDFRSYVVDGLNKFAEEVNSGAFPTEEYSYNTTVEGYEI
jgi:3-methyl-2-oxobutanoate hydroxymethyltransferase